MRLTLDDLFEMLIEGYDPSVECGGQVAKMSPIRHSTLCKSMKIDVKGCKQN